MDVHAPRTYAELVALYIAKGELLMTAESAEEGLALEAEMRVVLEAMREFEATPGFPSESDEAARARFNDWEAKHGVPDDGP